MASTIRLNGADYVKTGIRIPFTCCLCRQKVSGREAEQVQAIFDRGRHMLAKEPVRIHFVVRHSSVVERAIGNGS